MSTTFTYRPREAMSPELLACSLESIAAALREGNVSGDALDTGRWIVTDLNADAGDLPVYGLTRDDEPCVGDWIDASTLINTYPSLDAAKERNWDYRYTVLTLKPEPGAYGGAGFRILDKR